RTSSNPRDTTKRKEAAMSVTTVEPDLDNLTLTVVADFEASVEEVWELWANSEKRGRWWGPPEYLTTFEPYDLSAGAEMAHVMTGPDGDKHEGVWRIEAVDPPRSLEVSDADIDEDRLPNDCPPVTRKGLEPPDQH